MDKRDSYDDKQRGAKQSGSASQSESEPRTEMTRYGRGREEMLPWEPSGFRRFFEDFDRMFDQMRRQFFGGAP